MCQFIYNFCIIFHWWYYLPSHIVIVLVSFVVELFFGYFLFVFCAIFLPLLSIFFVLLLRCVFLCHWIVKLRGVETFLLSIYSIVPANGPGGEARRVTRRPPYTCEVVCVRARACIRVNAGVGACECDSRDSSIRFRSVGNLERITQTVCLCVRVCVCVCVGNWYYFFLYFTKMETRKSRTHLYISSSKRHGHRHGHRHRYILHISICFVDREISLGDSFPPPHHPVCLSVGLCIFKASFQDIYRN